MSESLALETQLLLQEVTQASQYEASVNVDVEGPPVSELEMAKRALVEKLRKKKDANKQQRQQLYMKRYGFSAPQKQPATADVTETPEAKAAGAGDPSGKLTPTKAKRMVRLPVAAAVPAGSRQKKDFLSKLRTQAVQQGANKMAKLFGHKSYEEQIAKLNVLEKKKILQSEQMEQLEAKKTQDDAEKAANAGDDEDSSSDFVMEAGGDNAEIDDDAMENEGDADEVMEVDSEVPETVVQSDAVKTAAEKADDYQKTQDLEALEAAAGVALPTSSPTQRTAPQSNAPSNAPARRRRNHIAMDEDDDGNEADSEEDGKEEDDIEEADVAKSDDEAAAAQKKNRDKAAAFRQLLQAEAKQERKRKRLRKGEKFVESEADEDEEEDVLKIGGLGDFGFGVPQAVSKESKEAEEERNALKIREDDLEGIVDDLSDDERDQQQDLDEIYRRELEEQDRQQVKEVMRNVKDGFGRNRRAFSALDGGVGARGRFNLNELVAADGDKLEAARLGLLESDEDMNGDEDDDEDGESKEKDNAEEEEDEEAEMERQLRERYMNQPKIYITSSESESEGENEAEKEDDEAAKEEIESDEERERQQMKLFSERARINRRMQRMKDMQRQIAQEVEEESAEKAPMPNLLLEEDEDSQSLLKVLTRTDVTKAPADTAAVATKKTVSAAPLSRAKSSTGTARSKVGRFSSFGMGSSGRSTSSFSRVADNCKLFSAGSGTSSATKGFVFTSFSSEKADNGDENAAPAPEDAVVPASTASSSASKSKSWGAPSRATKRPFAASSGANTNGTKKPKSDFFSVLASYQCVSQGTNSSEPM